jgi:hypothetical protein
MPDSEVARRTGRTAKAVFSWRKKLHIRMWKGNNPGDR